MTRIPTSIRPGSGERSSAPGPLRAVALAVALASTAAACASTSSTSSEPGGDVPPVDGIVPGDGESRQRVAPDPAPGEPEPDPADPVDGNTRDGDDEAPAPIERDLEVGGIGLLADDDAEVSTLDDGRTVVRGDVSVPTAGGDLDLADADIAVGIGPDGEPTVSGTARVPFPTEGAFADAEIKQLPIGEMGSAYGRDLAHLGAHLQDDTRYLFFAFDGGFEVDLPFAGQEGFEALPASISVPLGSPATLVLDPADPYFYVGTDCPDLPDNDKKNDDEKNDKDKKNDEDEQQQKVRDDEQPEQPEVETYRTLEPTNLPAGQECGIGISINGNIPAPATATGDAFTGHVVVDGIVPLYAGMELDGSAVIALRDPGARTVGWGTVMATVPLIDTFLDVKIPLADAAVEIQAEETRIGVAFDGSVGTDSPTYELPIIGMPITLPASGSATWDARMGFVKQAGGAWAIDPTSYAEMSGEFGIGLGSFGEIIGLDLSDAATQSGSLRIDTTGITANGATAVQVHPALTTGAAAEFALRVDAADWTKSRYDFVADVEVGGYTIGAADVSIGAQGMVVAGEVDLGFVRTAVTGRIDAAGFEFTGATAVDISLDGLAEASRSASGWLQERIDEVERLDDDIARARQQARDDRRERDAKFVAARDFLQGAIDDLDALDAETARNDAKIAELKRKIRAEKDRYADLSIGQKAVQSAKHLALLSGWSGDIGAREVRNVLIDDTLRPAAVLALRGAQESLDLIRHALDALPVDTNPKVATLLAARVSAVAALELAKGTVEAFEIEGSLRGEVRVRIASDGVGGSFNGELCGSNGCTPLPGGSVELGAEPAICVELPGLGEKCLRL